MQKQVTFALPRETLDWLRTLAGDTGRTDQHPPWPAAANGPPTLRGQTRSGEG